MVEQLIACGYQIHTDHDGNWLGADHERWVLAEQKRLYGDRALETPEITAALIILNNQLRRVA